MNLFLLLVGAIVVLVDKKSRFQSITSIVTVVVLGFAMVALSVALQVLASATSTLVGVLLLREGGFVTLCGYFCIFGAIKEVWQLVKAQKVPGSN